MQYIPLQRQLYAIHTLYSDNYMQYIPLQGQLYAIHTLTGKFEPLEMDTLKRHTYRISNVSVFLVISEVL